MAIFGYQAVYDSGFAEALRFAAANGFSYVSFDLNVPRFRLQALSPAEIKGIARLSRVLGVGLSFHAPGDNLSLYTDHPEIREGIMAHLRSAAAIAAELGAGRLTVHPGTRPSFRRNGEADDGFQAEYRDHYLGVLRENLLCLADYPFALCVENSPLDGLTAEALAGLFTQEAPVYLAWDIAKTYTLDLARDEFTEAFMRGHAERVREIHLHDIVPGFHAHQALGEGRLDLAPYLDLIGDERIAKTIEVRPREEALRSLQ
ncbi:MAG: sugar phosphate isomerase/epimerase family protein, partial [Patescibacteria group bacterium]